MTEKITLASFFLNLEWTIINEIYKEGIYPNKSETLIFMAIFLSSSSFGCKKNLVEKQKIIDNQKLTRRNPVIAVRQVEFGEKNQFLVVRKKFMITLANNESFFTIYNDKFDEWGRLKCIRGILVR